MEKAMWISERLYLREHKERPKTVSNARPNLRIRTAVNLVLGVSADPDEFHGVHDWMLSNVPELSHFDLLSLYAPITWQPGQVNQVPLGCDATYSDVAVSLPSGQIEWWELK
jgi:hypothetical protein